MDTVLKQLTKQREKGQSQRTHLLQLRHKGYIKKRTHIRRATQKTGPQDPTL